MRILWHGFAAPWEPSGYGTQTGIWTTYLKDRGHDVAISVCHGLAGTQSSWEGMTVYPAPLNAHVHSLLRHHAADFKPDVTIVLADLWQAPQAIATALGAVKGPMLAWMPIDLARHMSLGDVAVLKMLPRLRPVAMSEHGQRLLKSSAGIDAPYVPHAIDTFETWTPAPDRAAARRRLKLPAGAFLIGINSNNIDPYRKGYHEQFQAFADWRARTGADAYLAVHAMARMAGSTDLIMLAKTCGITDRVLFSDQERMEDGSFGLDHMRDWWSAMDVGSNTSLGEGFGLAAIEAQACGTPVILSNGTTGPQLVGPGWLVDTQLFWNGNHAAQWHMPLISHLAWTYGQAHKYAARRREQARDFATRYDIQQIGPMWDEVLATL